MPHNQQPLQIKREVDKLVITRIKRTNRQHDVHPSRQVKVHNEGEKYELGKIDQNFRCHVWLERITPEGTRIEVVEQLS